LKRHFGAREMEITRKQGETLIKHSDGRPWISGAIASKLIDEVIDRRTELSRREAACIREAPLGIEIDQEGSITQVRESRPERLGGRRLSNPTLLIRNGIDDSAAA
jgi:hypothetical protein